MSYKKFELEPIDYGKRPYNKKLYFQKSDHPPKVQNIEGKALRYRQHKNGEVVIPRLFVKIEPEKFVRKPPKEGLPDYESMLSDRKLRAGQIRFLWAHGWPMKKISERLGCHYNVVRYTITKNCYSDVQQIKPKWWEDETE